MATLARIVVPPSLLLTALLPAQTFAPPQVSPLPAGFAMMDDLVVADVDHDGLPDALAINSMVLGGSLSVLRGNGLGGFGAATATTLVIPRRLRVADVDGDERLDVWVGGFSGGSSYLHGTGTGAFVATAAPTLPALFCFGDFDGDGRLDLMTRTTTGFDVALGDGAGTFGAPRSFATSEGGTAMRAGDLDGDGDQDAIAGSVTSGTLVLLRNDGVANFVVEPMSIASGAARLDLADVDGDGDLDALVGAPFFGVAVHLNDGNGHFASVPSFSLLLAQRIAAGDVDGDGIPDLVVGGSPLAVYRGNGTGTFSTSESYDIGGLASGLALSDVDLDGGLDIVAIAGSPFGVVVLKNQQPRPTGISAYGVGTSACRGRIGMRAVDAPTIGNQGFHVLCSNAPTNTTGLLLMGTRVTGGWDPFDLDLVFHLGIALPVGTMTSDSAGAGRGSLPIPALPFLAGLTVNVQSFWLADAGSGDTCSPAWLDLVSSRGLSVTLQP